MARSNKSVAVVRYPRSVRSSMCLVCAKPVKLFSFQESAELFNTDVQDIEMLAKRGDLHRIHNSRGKIRICADSLFNCFNDRPTRLLDSHFTFEAEKSFEKMSCR